MRSGIYFSLIIFILLFISIDVYTQSDLEKAEFNRKDFTIQFVEPLPDHISSLLESKLLHLRSDKTNRDTLIIITSEILFQYGYFSSTVEIIESDEADSFVITPGERAVIGNIIIIPDEIPLQASVERRASELLDRPFSQPDIELWINSLLSLYDDSGRPFANVTLDSLSIENQKSSPEVTMFVTISNFDEVIIHTIRLEGNNETRESAIFRQARFYPGEVYSRERIDEIRPRLMQIGLFRSVAEPELLMDKNGGVIVLRVNESRFNSFDGIVGYIPEPATGGGYFTGLAHITMRNLFGTMRRLEARWQRETQHTQELFFAYREPFIAGYPLSGKFSFLQRQQDTTYVQTRTRILFDTEILRQFTVGVSYEREAVIPSADLQVVRVNRSSANLYGVDVRYDSRDNPYAPRSGFYYSSEYQTGKVKRTFQDRTSSETLQRLLIDFEYYISLFRRNVLAVSLHGREARSDTYQVSDLFRFGGTRSLRGYREGQFLGSRIAWSNLEYRYIVGARSYVFGFFDSGYYFFPELNEQQNQREAFKYGYGVGLQVETGIGIISVGFGFGEGDTFSTGKVHIGIVNEF